MTASVGSVVSQVVTFTDPGLCAAIVSRPTASGDIPKTGTTNYRLTSTRARHHAT